MQNYIHDEPYLWRAKQIYALPKTPQENLWMSYCCKFLGQCKARLFKFHRFVSFSFSILCFGAPTDYDFSPLKVEPIEFPPNFYVVPYTVTGLWQRCIVPWIGLHANFMGASCILTEVLRSVQVELADQKNWSASPKSSPISETGWHYIQSKNLSASSKTRRCFWSAFSTWTGL